ncbi:MAG TPA: benzoate/H(+) symporter BenE family transporter [Aliidongia sp.]|uniref:benzoate/H(+) symporter BenE family transporter n=1 Tax=Aliidongia sp. TaxID=1914230 RepID=UPI002DDCB7CD|nr:benzoate/H(+) symporter BenE family transporter [Aliidongia sp.]HEV2675592.1 benzoate/H(+) symporter BenE family transporter [Aliidongia sp.]
MAAIETAKPGISRQAIMTGIVTALVGYGSSVTVVVNGLNAVGATTEQAASSLLAMGVTMGITAIVLSLVHRMPISIAWSTPGAALLATTGPIAGGFAAAEGAFAVAGLLVVVAGLWRPIGRLVGAIPASLANALLGGILLNLCLAPFHALADMPLLAFPVILTWLVVGRFARLYALPATAIVALALLGFDVGGAGSHGLAQAGLWPGLVLTPPTLSWGGLVGIAVPLFVVTMASQNVPGLAVLATFGFRPPPRPIFLLTGLASLATAPVGALTVNLAAVTAALCAGPDADPRPERRAAAAVTAGLCYLLLGLLSAAAAALVATAPPLLIEAVAGLALLGAFGASVSAALKDDGDREAALVTFLLTASSLSFFGIGSAFWGLLGGLAVLGLRRLDFGRIGPGS